MKTDLLCQRRDLRNDFSKQVQGHQFLFSNDFGTKTTLKITDIANLDIHLLKTFSLDWSHDASSTLHRVSLEIEI